MFVPILHPREIKALWSRNQDTEVLLLLYVATKVSRVDNAVQFYRTGYDESDVHMRAIQMRWKREQKGRCLWHIDVSVE